MVLFCQIIYYYRHLLLPENYYVDKDLFRRLDREENGSLDFWDLMTLCYIIKTGESFFRGCDKFLTSFYFACVKCFQSSRGPYCIFLRRYRYPTLILSKLQEDALTAINVYQCRSTIKENCIWTLIFKSKQAQLGVLDHSPCYHYSDSS